DQDVPALVEYAAARNVGIHLWYNSGGPHTVINATPRDRMLDPEVRRDELRRIAAWGVRGIKVDFFQSDKQDRIQQYLDILNDARDARLLVNFHGATLPRGWQRTYPNLMSMEAVHGAEFYQVRYGPDAIHNVRLAYTRNIVGSMDYTPLTFAAAFQQLAISYGHQLALAVVFESGIQHFAERADGDPTLGFRKLLADAPFVKDFLREVPVAWDETRLLDGAPESHIVLARRRGEHWYVGALNGLEAPVVVDVPLDFLDAGTYAMRLIRSGAELDQLEEQVGESEAGGRLQVELRAKDGFVAVLEPAR
ncbi:MAG: glycoside hydrolase family 97 catalytic domain-containing protein, partial [Actinobacteria bacterium]|nr:glycoside hydrolase family 97 catalytic domain-containing protein [Actinomycetota bacterium]